MSKTRCKWIVDVNLFNKKRKQLGWNIKEVAKRSGLSYAVVKNFLSSSTDTTTGNKCCMAKALGLSTPEWMHKNVPPE